MLTAGSTPMQAESVRVLKEERIPPSEMEKVLSEFLKRKHVCDRISKEDLTRLKTLQDPGGGAKGGVNRVTVIIAPSSLYYSLTKSLY